MRVTLIHIIVMIVFAISGFSAAQDVSVPRIVIDETRFDAGKVTQGSSVSHVFEVKNSGASTLVINRIQAG